MTVLAVFLRRARRDRRDEFTREQSRQEGRELVAKANHRHACALLRLLVAVCSYLFRRDRLDFLKGKIVPCRPYKARIKRPRAKGQKTNLRLANFVRNRFAKVQNVRLGSVIGAHIRAGHKRRHRADVNNSAFVVFQHIRQKYAGKI